MISDENDSVQECRRSAFLNDLLVAPHKIAMQVIAVAQVLFASALIASASGVAPGYCANAEFAHSRRLNSHDADLTEPH
jgi:hypothetical protein